jgi:UDP-N-acetylglucosamine transferase subunit ALG13
VTRPLVFVAVGTNHHPFDRLLGWVARLSQARDDCDWLVQAGATVPGAPMRTVEMLDAAGLEDALARARVVVTHGGPGLILEARSYGHRPVVVPRRPDLGEHVDDHQLLFTARLAAQGIIRRVESQDAFDAAVARTLDVGPADPADLPAGTAAAEDFAGLVDDLLARPVRRRWWRRRA